MVSNQICFTLATGKFHGGEGGGRGSYTSDVGVDLSVTHHILHDHFLPLSPGPNIPDYTVENLIAMGLSGLVLGVLGVLVCHAWNSERRSPGIN